MLINWIKVGVVKDLAPSMQTIFDMECQSTAQYELHDVGFAWLKHSNLCEYLGSLLLTGRGHSIPFCHSIPSFHSIIPLYQSTPLNHDAPEGQDSMLEDSEGTNNIISGCGRPQLHVRWKLLLSTE